MKPFNIAMTMAVVILVMGLVTGSPVRADDRPYIGMQSQELPREATSALDLDAAGNAVMIRDVGRNTPAARAGVLPGDILREVNGIEVTSLAKLLEFVGTLSPEDSIDLSVSRNGDDIDLRLEVGSWPAAQAMKTTKVGQLPALGLTMIGLTGDVREQFSLRWDTRGLLVSLVDPSKGVSEIIQRGDIIVQVNQQDVWLPGQVIEIYRAARDEGQQQIVFLLDRKGGNALVMLPVK